MSGRGRGRGHKPSGRGRSQSDQHHKKKTLEEYCFHPGSAKHAADFESTSAYLINHIKKTFMFGNDVGTALEKLEPYDLTPHKPKLELSKAADAETRDAENQQLRMEFSGDYDAYKKRHQALEANMNKAYAFLWEHCTKPMQHKVESMKDYETTIKGNPIELLKSVKQQAMSFQEDKYDVAIINDALRTLVNLKQRDHEQLHEYTKRFRTAKEMVETHFGGPINVTKIVSSMGLYDQNDPKTVLTCINSTFERWMAYLYIDNADRSKYGSLIQGLQSQQSLGNNQYPKTIATANQVLSSHKIDEAAKTKGKEKSEKAEKTNEEQEPPQISFAQLEGKCYCCGKGGHRSSQCRYKSRPKEEWAITKARAEEQSHANAATMSANQPTPPQTVQAPAIPHSSVSTVTGWAGVHLQFHQDQFDLREVILLDNQSTTDIFCNQRLVQNIRNVDEQLTLSTNAGKLVTNLKADVPDYGTVWYHPEALTNIFSFSNMKKKHPIRYNQEDDKFIVEFSQTKQPEFKNNARGLYYYQPKYDTTKSSVNNAFVESVEENSQFYTPRQVERAKLARQVYDTLGTPSVKDFKTIVNTNAIHNLPVTIEDINIAEKIFGPDIGALKGKTTRKKPTPVIEDYIEIPPELIHNHQHVTLCIDGMFINGVPFLTTVSRHIQYRTVQPLVNQSASAYRSALDEIFRIYEHAGFFIKTIHCDNQFQPLLKELTEAYGVSINYANPQEHVPEIERSIRVIKERFRATFHRLPFTKIPRIMVQILAMECAKKLNFFPPKGGLSKYYSPRMILHQQNLDFKKHCSIPFGSYVQAHTEPDPTNTQFPRTIDCIYLRYVDSHQGGHEIMDLQTGRVIKRRTVTHVPITTAVIEVVHSMATRDGMLDGIKLTTKSGKLLYDSTLPAGVHIPNEMEADNAGVEEEYEEDEEYEEESNEDDEEYEEEDEGEYDAEYEEDYAVGYRARQSEEQKEQNDQDDQNGEQNQDDQNEQNTGQMAIDPSSVTTTRSGREIKKPEKFTLHQSHLVSRSATTEEYSQDTALVVAKFMVELNDKVDASGVDDYTFVETYSLRKGLQKFGERGYDAAVGEMRQMHDRTAFKPVHVADMTPQEKQRALDSLIFLTEKKDGRVKARTCANGSTQRVYTPRDEATSPTVLTESVLLTATVDAYEKRDVMTSDIPNAFIQTDFEGESKKKVFIKIKGALVDILLKLAPEVYKEYVVYEGNIKVLYVEALKAIYGMLQSALLFYKKLKKDVEKLGFEINPYEPCVANRMVEGKQQTIAWHVDDLKSSHVHPSVNDKFQEWLQDMYGDQMIAIVKTTRGMKHNYLGMVLDYSQPGKVMVDMSNYVKDMLNEFPDKLKTRKVPWNESLFKIETNQPLLGRRKAETFHSFVAKALFLCKRARQDIQPAVAFLSTRVKAPTVNDWDKLTRVMEYLAETRDEVLTLEMDNKQHISWYVDAAFAVHHDCRSHTGAVMTLGKGSIQSISTKQKINTRSSTEAELVSADDVLSKILWTNRFLEAQGVKIHKTIVYRDNLSSMKLEANGKSSCGKRTRHFDIKYFYITDLINRGEISIKYCPTEQMIADFMTKPITGAKFHEFRKNILNLQ
jgi:hypothetical protein